LSASPYDPIARVYDPWSASVTEDVEFYVAEARASGGPVVELACGTGRISIPVAKAGISLIGVDASAGMLEVAQEYGRAKPTASVRSLRRGSC
jgi:ubiquinone/menaquinone biosynthesis C-methylase UbiE